MQSLHDALIPEMVCSASEIRWSSASGAAVFTAPNATRTAARSSASKPTLSFKAAPPVRMNSQRSFARWYVLATVEKASCG